VEFEFHSSRNAEIVLTGEKFKADFQSMLDALARIGDDHIIAAFKASPRRAKSISEVLNTLIKEELVKAGWTPESPIFQDPAFEEGVWRLDFAKGYISAEVSFNHGEAVAWNLLKPVLASEYNHVQKASQTEVGIVICAMNEMKVAGGFDGAVGDYEKFKSYIIPLQAYLTVPILLIGLKAPKTFRILHQNEGTKKIGKVQEI
jgi:hypothetical protein